ncbi:hypothetical protein ANN_00500 [Periplaneta americana]|uniref:Uncharacterized protein n=1 Tax=Periplaneta americana TaxID=6978 RepID=A0ABQ8TTW2_PERAM|nr:hypothetical protein ANN_00500 [Periplaneta americana]
MSPGSNTESYPAFAHIGLRENPGKTLNQVISVSPDVPEFCPAGVLSHSSKSTDMSLSHLSTLKFHRPGSGSNPQSWALKASAIPTRQSGRLSHMELTYGCETCTLTLREEQRLRVSENKVLKKIFGAKRDGITGERRQLHKAELHTLYSSPNIIRNIKSRSLRWAGHVARTPCAFFHLISNAMI